MGWVKEGKAYMARSGTGMVEKLWGREPLDATTSPRTAFASTHTYTSQCRAAHPFRPFSFSFFRLFVLLQHFHHSLPSMPNHDAAQILAFGVLSSSSRHGRTLGALWVWGAQE